MQSKAFGFVFVAIETVSQFAAGALQ